MSNVIQFAPRKHSKLAREVASDVSLCLLLATGFTPKHRPEALEMTLKRCRRPHLARQALRAQGEAV